MKSTAILNSLDWSDDQFHVTHAQVREKLNHTTYKARKEKMQVGNSQTQKRKLGNKKHDAELTVNLIEQLRALNAE